MGHPHSPVHVVAARLVCKRTMAGTRWANSYLGYVNRLRKHYSHLLESSYLTGKASQALSGCLPTKNADHCMLVNEWAWLRQEYELLVKVTSLLIKPDSALGLNFGVRAQTEMKIPYTRVNNRIRLFPKL